MPYKIIAGVIAAALVITYMMPVVWRLKEVALFIVAGIGTVMMLIDLWQSLRSKED